MNTPTDTVDFDEDELGIESFDAVYNRRYGQPQTQQTEEVVEEKGFIEKAADSRAFGILGTPEIRRHAARTGARVFETLAGLPGDIRELFNSVAIGIPEYFAGEELPRWRRAVEGDQGMLGGITSGPTTREIREGTTKPLTGEYLEPQGKWEEFGDEVASDFAALAIPVKGKIPFARALGSSLIANAGGEVAKEFLGDKAQVYTKMGLLFGTGMLGHNQGGVKQYIRNLYKDMEGAIPEGAEISAKGLSSKLDKIESVLRKGDPADLSKQPAFQKISAIRDKIKDGFIPVDEVVELTKSTNESIFGLGELKRGQNQLYKVREALHDATKEFGKENPTFLEKWQAANEAYAATETSRRVSNWVKKNVKPKDYLYASSALGLEAAAFGPPSAGLVAGAGGLGATAYSAEVMKRIAQSPALRKYYLNVVTNSLKENKAGFMRAMRQLDDGLKKSFEEEPYETVNFEDEE